MPEGRRTSETPFYPRTGEGPGVRGSRTSAGNKLPGRAVRARSRSGTAALDQHHARRALDSQNRAIDRGVVPVGPTPPACRQRRPRRHRRRTAGDVVIHCALQSCRTYRTEISSDSALRVMCNEQGAPHRTACTLGAHSGAPSLDPAHLPERTERHTSVYFLQIRALLRCSGSSSVRSGPREYSMARSDPGVTNWTASTPPWLSLYSQGCVGRRGCRLSCRSSTGAGSCCFRLP
jgi:hypothetical protein